MMVPLDLQRSKCASRLRKPGMGPLGLDPMLSFRVSSVPSRSSTRSRCARGIFKSPGCGRHGRRQRRPDRFRWERVSTQFLPCAWRSGRQRLGRAPRPLLWHGSFPELWGDPACGGTCDTIILTGTIESGSVGPDGTVTLSGTAREIDKRRGEVVFDSGSDEPFYIVAGGSQGDETFILQWCFLPEFQIEGSLRVRVDDGDNDHDDGEIRALASSLGGGSRERGGVTR